MDELESVQPEWAFLGVVTGAEEDSGPWSVEVIVQGQPTRFKVDTGADVTAIPLTTYKQILSDSDIKPSDRTLLGAARTPLECKRMVKTELSCGENLCTATMYTVEKLHVPLLGKP